jgi:hypothetical protein
MMPEPAPKKTGRNPLPDRFSFFGAIQSLIMSAFVEATAGQKAAILAMSLGAVMFIGLGLVGSVALPAWAVVSMFVVGTLLIFATAGTLLLVERKAPVTAPVRCRQFPSYPLGRTVSAEIAAGLEEIRDDAASQIREVYPDTPDENIRVNIFILAQVHGGRADGTWKLVIPPEFAINMRHPPERQLQLTVGQGATGVAFRDSEYQLTRRQASSRGDWARRFQMTPELEAQIHKNLKWIVSFPLLRPNTREAVGVLNLDGLNDVPDDSVLHAIAANLEANVSVIAKTLSLEPSTCVGLDQLGVLSHA